MLANQPSSKKLGFRHRGILAGHPKYTPGLSRFYSYDQGNETIEERAELSIDERTRKMLEIFFRYDRKRANEIAERKGLLAHYTTAETAMKIIRGRSLWLRNAAVMNDFSEIEYGKSVMLPVLQGDLGDRYRAALDAISAGLADDVMRRHDAHRTHARETVFTASLSEHDPDDRLGRLSMWRAYGGPVAGVALLFHGWAADLELDPSLDVIASPVLYGDANHFVQEFADAITSIETNINFLKEFDSQIISNAAVQVLQLSMFSIKHLGFAEEREWRIIYRPYEYGSAIIQPFNVAIDGIPQTIYELPFHNPARGIEFDIPQLDLNSILAGVILGPCAYPETVFRALRDEMVAVGIDNPEKRIIVSNIPLRQQG